MGHGAFSSLFSGYLARLTPLSSSVALAPPPLWGGGDPRWAL
jgi:hypothetical protein